MKARNVERLSLAFNSIVAIVLCVACVLVLSQGSGPDALPGGW